MIPIDDNTYNNLMWENVDGQSLDSLLQGLQIMGAEPIDYPLTDGVIIYAKNTRTDKLIIINIGADQLSPEESGSPFYISIATV